MIKRVGKYLFVIGLTMALLQLLCLVCKPMQWLSFAESFAGWVMRLSLMLFGVLLILFGDELKEQH